MRVYEIQSFEKDGLVRTERSEPAPGPGEVLVRVRATSLNFRDLRMIAGKYNPHLKFPVIPLSDGAGEVVAAGEGVTRFKKGDSVCAHFTPDWTSGEPERRALRNTLGGPLDGMLAEYVVLPERGLVPMPTNLSFEEAATLPCAALTAWSSLVTYGDCKPGDVVVVQGTGGVSIFALQFAKLIGARVIITSSDDAKLQRARELGADEIINYRDTPDWEKEVYRLTDKRGADNIIEVGGAGTLEKSLRAVRPGGIISLIGILAGAVKDLNLLPILMSNIRVQGILVGHRAGFEAMNRAVEAGALKPVVDKVFDFNDAVEALAHLKSGNHFGKVCIRVAAD